MRCSQRVIAQIQSLDWSDVRFLISGNLHSVRLILAGHCTRSVEMSARFNFEGLRKNIPFDDGGGLKNKLLLDTDRTFHISQYLYIIQEDVPCNYSDRKSVV